MAATFRASSQQTAGYASGGVTVAEPTGTAQDDILIAWVATGEGSGWTAPSGWNQGAIENIDAGGGKLLRVGAYWIRRGASAPSLTWTRTSSTSMSVQVAAVQGADTDVIPEFSIAENSATTSLGATVTMPASGGCIISGSAGADGAGTAAVSGTLTETQDSGVVESGFLGPNNLAYDDGVSSGDYTATHTNSTSMERVVFAAAIPTNQPVASYANVRSISSTTAGYASGDVTATEPASAAENDILIAQVVQGEGSGLPGLPSGWTSAGTVDQGSGSPRLRARFGWIRRGASAPSLAFTRSGTSSLDIKIWCVTNASTTTDPVFDIDISGSAVTSISPGPVTVSATRGALVGGSVGVAGAGSAGVSTTNWVEDAETTAEAGYNGPCNACYLDAEAAAGSQSVTFTNTTSMVRAAFIAFVETEATGLAISPTGPTVTATAGSLTVTPPAQAVSLTGPTVSVSAGSLTVTQVTPISVAGPTVTATPGTLTVTTGAVDITPTAPTVGVTAGTLTVTPGAVGITPVGPTVTVTAGTLTLDLAIGLTGATVNVTPGNLAVGPAVLPTGPTITVTPGSLTVAPGAVGISPVGPTVTVAAGTLTVALGASPTQEVTPAAPTITVTAGTLSLGLSIAPTAPTITVTPGTASVFEDLPLTVDAPTVNVTPGTLTITQGLAVVPDGPTVNVTAGSLTVTTGAVDVSPVGPTVTVTPGTLTVLLAQPITLVGPTVSVSAGTLTVIESQPISLVGPTVGVTPGTITLTVSGPAPIGVTITVTPGTLDINAGLVPERSVYAETYREESYAVDYRERGYAPTYREPTYATTYKER